MTSVLLSASERVPVKGWVRGVSVEAEALAQLRNLASLPFVFKHVAVMPDVHLGKGATVGSVIATRGAIVPAAVGVDIGCGMMAVRTNIRAEELPDNLLAVRTAIEAAVPHGRTDNGGPNDKGAWTDGEFPLPVTMAWASGELFSLMIRFMHLCQRTPVLVHTNNLRHLGTLGTGNHFIELCIDEAGSVWVMLHSGSRGVGGAIGGHFIAHAKREMERWYIDLADKELAYIPEGSEHFDAYIEAVDWAQDFAAMNRHLMMIATLRAVSEALGRPVVTDMEAINCHHNYVAREHHYGQNVLVTRKGAVRARAGDLGIIPGSMGAKSYIVRGKGEAASFCSCSHGAGRVMSRTEAKRRFTLADHEEATRGVECRKDEDVIDETPGAYKPIEDVMAAQEDLVEIVHTLKQVVCVKG